jgi:hypothetical protein
MDADASAVFMASAALLPPPMVVVVVIVLVLGRIAMPAAAGDMNDIAHHDDDDDDLDARKMMNADTAFILFQRVNGRELGAEAGRRRRVWLGFL